VTDVVVYGATGATGSRFAEIAVAHGMRPIVAGRNREALKRIAGPLGLELRVGTLDPAELDVVCRGASVVLSCVAPYTTTGVPVLEAALRQGAHYLDCTGEPRYVKRLIDRYDSAARQAGSAIIPSAGLGLCANIVAQTAADGVPIVGRMIVDYRIRRMRPSWGTISSTVRILAGGAAVIDRGAVTFRASGGRVRRVAGGIGVRFPLTDTLTFSRLWPEASIESYLRTPAAPLIAPLMMLTSLAGRSELMTRNVERLARHRQAPDAKPSRGEFVVTVTAEGAGRRAVATAHVPDVYELTSQAAFELTRALVEHGVAPGFRASGEVVGNPQGVATRIGVTLDAPPTASRIAAPAPERARA
jgi:hypothetical protein